MQPGAPYLKDVRIIRNAMVSMRDGVRLATTVYLPAAEGRYPAVLVRTAYNRAGFRPHGYCDRGLALVSQDTRGRYGSEGDFYPFTAETHDGLDTLDWLVQQPWCNGRVGMFGDSYLGGTQLALAHTQHPALAAFNPRFISGDLWRQGYYCDGAFSLALVWSWLCLECGSRTSEAHITPMFDSVKLLRELPLLTLDEKSGGHAPAYRDYLEHPARDAYWQEQSYRGKLDRCTTPMLLTGGWYDYYPNEVFRCYAELMQGPDAELRRQHRVIVGPWMHGINYTTTLGELDFGPDSMRENDSTERWLRTMLTGGATAADFQTAPIRVFTMGANTWRDEHDWPLARTKWTTLFLHSRGSANSLEGDGTLSATAPGDESPDRYAYDPANPVPTWGGNHSIGPWNPGLYEQSPPGPFDQRKTESRPDVLVYTSAVLEEDMDVTGPVRVTLFASSSAVDTDWVARLSDVHPDGRAMCITEGVIRAGFRARQWDRTEPLEPGKVYEFVIELQDTSNVFLAGHRLRLDITSSNFPLLARNLNTGEHPAHATRWVVAQQTVRHDAAHPSHVLLPVIPQR